MSLKINLRTIFGYLLIYFMLIWNQSNLGETFLKKYMLPILIIFMLLVLFRSKRLTIWCGLLSIVLVLFAFLIRFTVGGIGIIAVASCLSSVYIVAYAVIYNKELFFTRLVKVIYFLAFASLILWGMCLIVPELYENLIPSYKSLMTYRIYSDVETYKEINYISRGLFLYTLRGVERFRNAGIFTEPGVYQMVLNLGIFLILFFNNYIDCKNMRKKLLILIIALITSQSTTGFIGLMIIFIGYCFTFSSAERKILSKNTMAILGCCITIVLLVDYQIRGTDSLFYITVVEKLFSKGTFSLTDNGSSAARVGTIVLSIKSIIRHPLGVGYTNLGALLNTEKTGFVAAEILSFPAVWGIIPWMFVLWWIFSPLKNKMRKLEIVLYILLYVNTLLAQSNMFYPAFILLPVAFKYASVAFKKMSE